MDSDQSETRAGKVKARGQGIWLRCFMLALGGAVTLELVSLALSRRLPELFLAAFCLGGVVIGDAIQSLRRKDWRGELRGVLIGFIVGPLIGLAVTIMHYIVEFSRHG